MTLKFDIERLGDCWVHSLDLAVNAIALVVFSERGFSVCAKMARKLGFLPCPLKLQSAQTYAENCRTCNAVILLGKLPTEKSASGAGHLNRFTHELSTASPVR